MSRSRLVGIVLLAGGLLLAGVFYWRSAREISVQTIPVQRDIEVRVFGIGTVEAQILSKIGFQIAGKVVTVAADQGDQVKAGALLAKLDDTAQRSKLLKSEVAMRQAAATLVRAQA